MKKILIIITVTLSTLGLNCKDKECPKKATPYVIEAYEFELEDFGSGNGYCGIILTVYDSLYSTILVFKPVNVPSKMQIFNASYRGKLEVLPETYKCFDGGPDPLPGKPSPTIYPHFVNIIEWERK